MPPELNKPSSNKITFIGAHGTALAARLDLPQGQPRAYALFAHCFTCSKDIFAASRIASALTGHGIAVLRFDFTGLGASEGEFANTNFSSNVEDLVAAAGFMRGEFQAPKIIIGHSLGGAAVLAAAKHIAEVEAVVTINAPADPAHVVKNFHCSLDEIEKNGEAEVSLAGRTFKIRKQFLDDMSKQNLSADIAAMDKALLVFHAPMDELVSVDNAATIFSAAKHPKSFISLDGADHLLHRKEDAIYVAGVITAWAERYIANDQLASSARPAPVASPNTVVVAEDGDGKYSQWVSFGGRHLIRADEPIEVGGDDKGGSPYELVLAGLGACTAMTLRMYAARKKLNLDKVSVSMGHEKIHSDDCEGCEAGSSKIDHIERTITMEGDLSPDDRRRLLEIADKCPVHRTLHSVVKITTTENSV